MLFYAVKVATNATFFLSEIKCLFFLFTYKFQVYYTKITLKLHDK